MATNIEYPLSARFIFKGEPGTSQMNRTGRAFKNLHKNAMMAQAGVQQIGSGIRQLSMAGAAITMVMVGVVRKAANFNRQMDVVRSVTTVGAAGFEKMRVEAMRLGASTSFSSQQAAEGMEHLARAGFSAGETLTAISPALRMAEADSMNLATAAKIVAAQIKAFKLPAKEAVGVADALAYTSAKTATDVTELGEALKYSAATASAANQTYRDTIGSLGMLANIGIRGSLAGTALKNAFLKLTRMTKDAQKLFGGKDNLLKVLTFGVGKRKGQMRPLHLVIKDTIDKLRLIPNAAIRGAMAFRIFGLRGKAMMDALRVAKDTDLAKVFDDMATKSKGMAMKMSQMRLDNLAGKWVIFKSALDNAAISIGNVVAPALEGILGDIRGKSGLIRQLQQLSMAVEDMGKNMSESDLIKKYGSALAGVAFGVKEAYEEVKETVTKAMGFIAKMFGRITSGGGTTVKTITKVIAKFAMFAVVLTPVVAGIGALGIVGGGAFSILIGGMRVLSALTTPWGIGMMLMVNLFAGFGKKGESTFERMARGVKNLTSAIYTLTWPLRKAAEYIGTINTLLIAMAGYKITKMLITGKLASMAGRGGASGRMMGMAGAGGMPVFVTNWPLGGGIPGGRGGGIPGTGTSAPTAAASGGASFLQRLGVTTGAGGTGMSALYSSMFGGKVATSGAVAMKGGVPLATAAKIGTLGTAITGLGIAAATFLPVWGALSQINQAYLNPHETRQRLTKGYKDPETSKTWRPMSEPEEVRKKREALGKSKLNAGDLPALIAIIEKAKSGKSKDIGEAKEMLREFRRKKYGKYGESKNLMNTFGIGFGKLINLGFSDQSAQILKALTKLTGDQMAQMSEGIRGLSIVVDGKILGRVIATNKTGKSIRGGVGGAKVTAGGKR